MIKRKQKKNKMLSFKFYLFYILFLWFNVALAQSKDTTILKKQAIQLVTADMLVSDEFIDGPKYNVRILKNEDIFDCYFLLLSPKDSVIKGSFFLAFSTITRKFYMLRGFKTSEFNDFVKDVLIQGHFTITKGRDASVKGRIEYIKSSIHIEGIDFKNYFNTYYQKYKTCLYDPYSCYRKYYTHILVQ